MLQRSPPPGKARVNNRLGSPIRHSASPNSVADLAEQLFGDTSHQFFASPIYQDQPLLWIESKYRDIDFSHDRPKQRGRFHRIQPLAPQMSRLRH